MKNVGKFLSCKQKSQMCVFTLQASKTTAIAWKFDE